MGRLKRMALDLIKDALAKGPQHFLRMHELNIEIQIHYELAISPGHIIEGEISLQNADVLNAQLVARSTAEMGKHVIPTTKEDRDTLIDFVGNFIPRWLGNCWPLADNFTDTGDADEDDDDDDDDDDGEDEQDENDTNKSDGSNIANERLKLFEHCRPAILENADRLVGPEYEVVLVAQEETRTTVTHLTRAEARKLIAESNQAADSDDWAKICLRLESPIPPDRIAVIVRLRGVSYYEIPRN